MDSVRPQSKISRLRVCIYLHMQKHGFDPVPAFIGASGYNTKRIVEASGARITVRGVGSRFGHGGKEETQTPLRVLVSAPAEDTAAFRVAVTMTLQVLKTVSVRYRKHCAKQGSRDETPCWTFSILEAETQKELKGLVHEKDLFVAR